MWVKYIVKYIHVCIMLLMHDVNMVINNEQSLKTTLAFVAKLGCSSNILSI